MLGFTSWWNTVGSLNAALAQACRAYPVPAFRACVICQSRLSFREEQEIATRQMRIFLTCSSSALTFWFCFHDSGVHTETTLPRFTMYDAGCWGTPFMRNEGLPAETKRLCSKPACLFGLALGLRKSDESSQHSVHGDYWIRAANSQKLDGRL